MKREEAVKLLNGLKRNTCWCEVGIDNPNYQGIHTAACLAVQEFMKEPSDKDYRQSREGITSVSSQTKGCAVDSLIWAEKRIAELEASNQTIHDDAFALRARVKELEADKLALQNKVAGYLMGRRKVSEHSTRDVTKGEG